MLFLISIVLVFVNSIDRRFPFIPEQHKENSLLYRPLSRLAPAIFPFLNFGEVRERLREEVTPEFEAWIPAADLTLPGIPQGKIN